MVRTGGPVLSLPVQQLLSWLVGLLIVASPAALMAAGDVIPIQGNIPSVIMEAEVVYVEGKAPAVTLKSASEQKPPVRYRPHDRTVDLLPTLDPEQGPGVCQATTRRSGGRLHITLKQEGGRPCELLLSVKREGAVLDALSFHRLHVRGHASKPVTLGLVDASLSSGENAVPLAKLVNAFDVRIPLDSAARELDLRDLVAVMVQPHSDESTVLLEVLSLEQSSGLRSSTARRGFWVWNYREALAESAAIVEVCRAVACSRLLIQMPALEDHDSLWVAYTEMLLSLQVQGIEAFALDGSPDAIYEPAPLVKKVRRLLSLLNGQSIGGVQLDIEPYLLREFYHDTAWLPAYLGAFGRVKAAWGPGGTLSAVIPFWFASYRAEGRAVAFSVMDRVDEVAVMSYRTTREELEALAEDVLRYGDAIGLPVWLAVETTTLPVEQHVVLKPEPRLEMADAYLDRVHRQLVLAVPPSGNGLEGFRAHNRFTLRPERLTFAGQPQGRVNAFVTGLLKSIPNPSFTGMLIHDYHGYRSLVP